MATPYAYFQKKIVPLSEAKIGVMTHAFNYGTAVFEGIRGNWNAEEEQIYVFRIKEHYDRLRKSCRIMQHRLPVRRRGAVLDHDAHRRDVGLPRGRLHPPAGLQESSEILGVRLHDLEDDFLIFIAPFGPYLDIEKGARCQTSSWRRVADTGIPARAKITGIYANSALAKTEANLNGFDEAIMLDERGHISEGSGENIFVVRTATDPHAAAFLRHPRRHHARHGDHAGPRGAGHRRRGAGHRPHGAVHGGRVLHDRHGGARHAGGGAGPAGDRRRTDRPGDARVWSTSTSRSSPAATPSTPTGAPLATQRSKRSATASQLSAPCGRRERSSARVSLYSPWRSPWPSFCRPAAGRSPSRSSWRTSAPACWLLSRARLRLLGVRLLHAALRRGPLRPDDRLGAAEALRLAGRIEKRSPRPRRAQAEGERRGLAGLPHRTWYVDESGTRALLLHPPQRRGAGIRPHAGHSVRDQPRRPRALHRRGAAVQQARLPDTQAALAAPQVRRAAGPSGGAPDLGGPRGAGAQRLLAVWSTSRSGASSSRSTRS